MTTVISVENLGKAYQLGQIGTGTLTNDLRVWWAKVRDKPNPLLRVGELDHGNRDGETMWALKDVNFTVQQGEALGIIGRNGAGKSTLLKILSQVTAPTSGMVKVKGRVASLLEVGTGFQPELTGRENIYLNGAIMGMSHAEISRKFDEIVDFSGVENFIDTPVKRYSSGMYVRLAFAVAAHLDPEILVVDEVLAVGDAEFQTKCLGKMGEVSKQGRTVLFVSHNMVAIKTLCQAAILLEGGQLVSKGEVNTIIDSYLRNDTRNSSYYVIPQEAPRMENGEARFQTVQMIDSANNPTTTLYLGQSFKVIITFDLFTDVKDAILEVGIVTIDGTMIVQSFSTDDGEIPSSLAKGRYKAVVELMVQLLPRSYSLLLGIHHASNGATMDFVERTVDFSILNIAEHGDNHYRWPTRGFVRPSTDWNISLEGSEK